MILIDPTERIRSEAALEAEIQIILPFLDRRASPNKKAKLSVFRLPEQLQTRFFQWDLSESMILIDSTERIRSAAGLGGEIHRFQ